MRGRNRGRCNLRRVDAGRWLAAVAYCVGLLLPKSKRTVGMIGPSATFFANAGGSGDDVGGGDGGAGGRGAHIGAEVGGMEI